MIYEECPATRECTYGKVWAKTPYLIYEKQGDPVTQSYFKLVLDELVDQIAVKYNRENVAVVAYDIYLENDTGGTHTIRIKAYGLKCVLPHRP